MSIFELYLLTRLDAVSDTFNGLAVLCGFAAFFLAAAYAFFIEQYDVDDDEYKATIPSCKKWFKRSVVGFLISITICALLPTTKELAIIYGLNYVTNNEEAKQLPDNILKVVNKQLEEWSEESK